MAETQKRTLLDMGQRYRLTNYVDQNKANFNGLLTFEGILGKAKEVVPEVTPAALKRVLRFLEITPKRSSNVTNENNPVAAAHRRITVLEAEFKTVVERLALLERSLGVE
jgi:hypothetical protein